MQTSAKTLELTEEFWRGAAWLSFQICATARRNWPQFVVENLADLSRGDQVLIIAALCGPLEGWMLLPAGTEKLPEFSWGALFGASAAEAVATQYHREYQRFHTAWHAVGCGALVGAVNDVGFLQGARSAARAICIAARQMVPRVIAAEFGGGGDRRPANDLTAIILALIAGWLGNYVDEQN